MARVSLRCVCGYFVLVQEAQLSKEVLCPSCRRPIRQDAPSIDELPEPPVRPPTTRKQVETVALSGKMIGIIAGGAGLLIVVIIVLIVALTGGSNSGKHAYNDPDVMTASSSLPISNPIRRPSGSAPPLPARNSNPDGPNYVAPSLPLGSVAPQPTAPVSSPPPTTGQATPPVAPTTNPPPVSVGAMAVPPETLNRAREIMALPPFYKDLCMTPAERARAEGVASSGKGMPEDVQFLAEVGRSPKIAPVQEEMSFIRESLARFEKTAMESLPTDVIVLQSGQSFIGRIVDETPETLRIERRMTTGVTGMQNIKREDIKVIQKGKGIGAEFVTKWETASKGTITDLAALMNWCKENSLGNQAKLVAFRILKNDPGYAPARTEVSLPADPVRAYLDTMSRGGYIMYEGRKWDPKELKDQLIKQGFVAINGQWFVKREKTFSIPGLPRYEKQKDRQVVLSSTIPICQETEMSWRSATVPGDTTRMKEIVEYKPVRSFYAPALGVSESKDGNRSRSNTMEETDVLIEKGNPAAGQMQTGEVIMSISVGQPMVEASVKTLAETRHDGSIVIYMTLNGERIRLYDCHSKEDQFHKLPDSIRGQTAVELVAVFQMTAAYTAKNETHSICPMKEIYDQSKRARVVTMKKCEVIHERQIPEYRTMLFPSTTTTNEVFCLKAVVAEPAPGLTKLYTDINATDLLKSEAPAPGK